MLGYQMPDSWEEEQEMYWRAEQERQLDKHEGRNQPKSLSRRSEVGKLDWIVDQFLATGATLLLAAEKGSGKTALVMRLAQAVAAGSMFLSQLPTHQGKVLLIQCDEPEQDTMRKAHLMDFPDDLIDVVWFEGTLDLVWLQGELNSGQYILVIIDSATNGLATENCEVTDTGFTRKLYKICKMISSHKSACLITSHLRKPQDNKERLSVADQDIAGLSTIGNAVSDIWGLVRIPNTTAKFRLNCLGKRNCRRDTVWLLDGSQEDLSFELTSVGNGDEMPVARKTLREKILNYLQMTPGFHHPSVIAEAVSSSTEVIRRYCAELFAEEQVNRKKQPGHTGRPQYLYGGFPTYS